MKKPLILSLISLASTGGYSQVTPIGYEILQEIEGDLTKNGVNEKVIVFETDRNTDFGKERELHIFSKEKNSWIKWMKSNEIIGRSEDGGMMTDSFVSIEISKSILIITHAGGSSWKWNDINKFSFQKEDFFLIGTTNMYGKICEYWQEFDFNLSTGNVTFKKEFEECDNQEQRISQTLTEQFQVENIVQPTISNFKRGKNKIQTPDNSIDVFY